ncbi:hypothetical protein Tco_1294607 [Tanacetum coccineum]
MEKEELIVYLVAAREAGGKKREVQGSQKQREEKGEGGSGGGGGERGWGEEERGVVGAEVGEEAVEVRVRGSWGEERGGEGGVGERGGEARGGVGGGWVGPPRVGGGEPVRESESRGEEEERGSKAESPSMGVGPPSPPPREAVVKGGSRACQGPGRGQARGGEGGKRGGSRVRVKEKAGEEDNLVLVDVLKEKSINKAEVLTIMEEEGNTWMTPIYEYLTEETLLAEKKKTRSVRLKSRRYAVINGVLYKKSFFEPWLRCVRPLQANYVLREIHEGSCSMHAGPRNPQQKLTPITSPWPFYKWRIDIAGPFPEGDENHIRTLGDYSKPSHEGYKNTIELPVGNNVVPLRSYTIRLVQNGCSFYELQSEDPNQHLKDFLKLVDSLDFDGENKERTRLRLFQFSLRDKASNWLERLPAGSITT